MKTVNSISGGKTSAYIAAHYPADYDVFSLVRTNDKNCLYPDKKVRKIVSDKIGQEFVGTLEDDVIIQTVLELEQFIGTQIHWVSAKTFDEIIIKKANYLPNKIASYCTTELKMQPIFDWWKKELNEIIEMRIGFRANEQRREKTMLDKTNANGISEFKSIIGKTKTGNLNRWKNIEWRKPVFPLIKDNVYKDTIEKYWDDKPVRFAYMNNCVGCWWRSPLLLKKMSDKHPNKMKWFADQETSKSKWRSDVMYKDIINWNTQTELFDDDFNECDSGYCGI